MDRLLRGRFLRPLVLGLLVSLHALGFLALDAVLASASSLAFMAQPKVVQMALLRPSSPLPPPAMTDQPLPSALESVVDEPAPKAPVSQAPVTPEDANPPAVQPKPPSTEELAESATQPQDAESTRQAASALAQAEEPHSPPTSLTPSVSSKEAALAFEIPASVRLDFDLVKGGESGRAQIVWRHDASAGAFGDGSGYELTQTFTKFGLTLFEQNSTGLVRKNQGLQPKRHAQKRLRQSERAAHFEYKADGSGTIIFSNNHPTVSWPAGEPSPQDRTSVIVQLVGWFRANPQWAQTQQSFELPVASVDELQSWRFERLGIETIAPLSPDLQMCKDAPEGARAVHLKRSPRRAYDATLEMWLAVGCGYWPLRVRQTDSSGVTELTLLAMRQP